MPYLAPTLFEDRRALMANTDAQEQQTETSRLRNMLLGQQEQRANELRKIYSQGGQPSVAQIGAVDPNAALEYQNNQSLQAQRESENMMRKQSALKGIMTRFRDVALQRGYDPSRPETQHILEDLRPAFTPYIESVTGQKAGAEPVSWDNVVALSDMTPGELEQQKTQQEISRLQQIMPYQLEQERQKHQIGNEYDIAKQEYLMPMQEARDKNVAQYKADIEFANQEKLMSKGLKPQTESQAKASTFASQMDSANRVISQLNNQGYDQSTTYNQLGASLAGGYTNILASPEAQQLRQAQNQWAEAFLRIKTGAAATEGEVERNVETFFPRVGDDEAVVKQKAAMRQQAQQDVLKMTGRQGIGQSVTGSWGDSQTPQIPKGAITRHSPSTGRTEYSTDGGETWTRVK